MKGLSRIGRLSLKLLLVVFVPLGRSEAQSTNQVEEAADVSTAPPASRFISPFSGVAMTRYSYTNAEGYGGGSLGVGGLRHDPFSRTVLPGLEAAPANVPLGPMPELIGPVIVELPPGATIQRATTPVKAAAVPAAGAVPRVAAVPHVAPKPAVPVETSEMARFEFPPAATIRQDRR